MLRLRDDQWEGIREHFPEEHLLDSRPGRKPIPAREVIEDMLWILNAGAQWHLLPQCYPNYKTVHRRFQQWCEREVLWGEGASDERESFIDGMQGLILPGSTHITCSSSARNSWRSFSALEGRHPFSQWR